MRADGEADVRGTLGVQKDVAVEFQDIRLHFELDTDASGEQLSMLPRLTERYCLVYQTVSNAPRIDMSQVRDARERRRGPVSTGD